MVESLAGSVADHPGPRDWDFRDADTKEGTHVIHSYPAMMIPQVARHLIDRLRALHPTATTLVDPFCGAGTVLVEASRQGLQSWGNDLNPLAVRIAQARTTPISDDELTACHTQLIRSLTPERLRAWDGPIPEFPGRDFWFKPPVSKALAFIRELLAGLADDATRRLCEMAFSETVRRVSNSRNREFKLYRLPEPALNAFQPDVLSEFLAIITRYMAGVREYQESLRIAPAASITQGDSRTLEQIPDLTFDLMVTSPPYGDSRTTVAYGQFSRLSLEWLGLPSDQARTVDRRLMGGARRTAPHPIPSLPAQAGIEAIRSRDPRRAQEVASFYLDLDDMIRALTRKLKPGALAAWVVANRTVKEVVLPTNDIVADLSRTHGFEWVEELTRNIPMKRMPRANSPSNVAGQTGRTMIQERLVIMRFRG